MLDVFDAAGLWKPNCELPPNVSTVAPQSLMLMNNDFILQQADDFADRVQTCAAGDDVPARCNSAWDLAFGRRPTQSA